MANKVKIPRNTPKQIVQEVPKESVLVPVDETPSATVKRVLKSKTIWINAIAFLSFWVQKETGFFISEDLQMLALTIINIALRFVTKEPITWGGDGNTKEDS